MSGVEETYVLDLRYEKPPLSLNGRPHWRVHRRITHQIHERVRIACVENHLPATVLHRPTVQLVYNVHDKRRRDRDNLIATAKPAVDGLVRAGVVIDDDPMHLEHLMPAITNDLTRPVGISLVVQP